ncbi:hypothetical protein ACFQPG_04320 [Sphingomonas sp. GCM10030256]|uniref:hypothetical protein n=1 Tax=Sphingomonas sp. GCM10030256 TaxID=3273427 RepID=UPI0036179909
MQRIRIGLTGLAFVFLLVLLGTVILRSSGDDAAGQGEPNLSAPNEPLAELGVAPAQEDGANTGSAANNAL